MKLHISTLVILIAAACVDRIDIEVSKPKSDAISIGGYISNQPGPYEIRIQNVYDIESKETLRSPVSVKEIALSDNQGNSEILEEVRPGFYLTHVNGMQGVIGNAYKIRIELWDGRIYESWPDTIKAPGKLDSMYYSVRNEIDNSGSKLYFLDVFFNATYKATPDANLIWKFRGTFQAETQPELYFEYHMSSGLWTGLCFYLDEIFKCNLQPPCSGLRNIGFGRSPVFERQFPCSCCTCWYNIVNRDLVLSSDLFVARGEIKGMKIQSVPLNEWTLLNKIRLSTEQHSLTKNSFKYYKAIQNQKEAIGSLFQPVTGQIPSNFKQLSGSIVRAEGLFYATALSSKVKYITKDDLPFEIYDQLPRVPPFFPDDCRLLFPNATNIKPTFWVD